MYFCIHVKYPLYLSPLTDFRKFPNIKFHKKIRLLGAVLFHADKQAEREWGTDRFDEGNSRFSQFFKCF